MNNDIIILTIGIYIAGVKNRAGFATDTHTYTHTQTRTLAGLQKYFHIAPIY